ncbi:MAG: CRISPR-associated endoribonuclease Cas6 [Candidatus Nitrosocaldus sp.]|nr:CRISPR-associated endoribonuclease Cas6 [Candidatus Nitrosocaldus sp.]
MDMLSDESIVRIKFRLSVDRELEIPPFSSKVSRTIVLSMVGDKPVLDGDRYKSYTISPLLVNNRPLIRVVDATVSDKAYNLRLYPSNEYSFYVSAIGSDMITAILSGKKDIQLFNGTFTISGIELTATTFHTISLEKGDDIIIRFVTPALLQLPRKWGERKRAGNFLFPVPSLLIWSVAQHWNRYAPQDLKIESCKRLAVYSNFAMLEMDYSLRPLAVVYNEVSRPKGITGWVRWHIDDFDEGLAVQLRRILAYAQYFGVGRSRSIGFGMVDIVRP